MFVETAFSCCLPSCREVRGQLGFFALRHQQEGGFNLHLPAATHAALDALTSATCIPSGWPSMFKN